MAADVALMIYLALSGPTFALLDTVPQSALTTIAGILAAFLFIVTSVVSAANVLAGFSSGSSLAPGTRLKLVWGAMLAAH